MVVREVAGKRKVTSIASALLRVVPPLSFSVCTEITSVLCREALRARSALDRPRVVVFGAAISQFLGGLGVGFILCIFWAPLFDDVTKSCPSMSSVSAFDFVCMKHTTPFSLRVGLLKNYIMWPFILHLVVRIVNNALRARHDVFPDVSASGEETGPELVTRIILESEKEDTSNEDEFLEIYIHYARVTMFSTLSPLIPALSLIGLMVETRVVPHKLVGFRRRPIPRRATAIKGWTIVFKATSRFCGLASLAICTLSLSLMDIFPGQRDHVPGSPVANYWKEALIAILVTDMLVRGAVHDVFPFFWKLASRL